MTTRGPALALLVALVTGCGGREKPAATPFPTPADPFRPAAGAAAPDLDDRGAPESLRRAVAESLAWLETLPPGTGWTVSGRRFDRDLQREALSDLLCLLESGASREDLRRWLVERFEPFASRGGETGRVLVTGYFEPAIAASLSPGPGFAVPIHAPPPELVTAALRDFSTALPDERITGRIDGARLVPFCDRRAIRRLGCLAGRGLEIAWAADEVDLFFLEVQGSGRLLLPDGSERRIGYAAANGRPYRSIGKLLADEGRIPRDAVSMQSIRAWLDAHPRERERVLDHNESLVFFRFLEGAALGSLGRPLTPGRSVAADPRLVPPGSLLWLESTWPEATTGGRTRPGGRLARLVLVQDAGGAIRGAGRLDLFLGAGRAAGERAGRMRQEGRFWLLVPRPAAPGPKG